MHPIAYQIMKHFLLIISFTCLSLFANAQLVYDNMVYDQNVKTVILTKAGVDDRYPIISLNTSEQLELGFDVIGNKNEYFQYTVVHCDANWNPTPMNQNDYLQGVTFDNINDFRYSTNTYVKYIHYGLLLPNENMQLRIAGNYLLKVYRNFDEEDLVLTRKFWVLNNSVKVTAKVQPSTLAQHRFTKQEVTFEVDYTGFNIVNPFNDVKVQIMQNGRLDNALSDIKPQFIQNNKLQYNDFEQALFKGSNEFRFFDFRGIRQLSPNVRTKTFDSVYHLILNTDESRGSNQYVQYIDNNGRRIIDNKDGRDSRYDGDYAWVNFYLSSFTPLQDKDVYVFGEFTDWKLLPQYKLSYNKSRSRYDLEVPLKQGRYEYLYAVKDEATGKPDETYFEGSHANTENEYVILIYHKHLMYKYDELIGAARFKTQF